MMDDFFKSGSNRLHYRYYPVEGHRGVCVSLHGHGEHAGRFEKMQKMLESEKVSFAIFEYRGQGRSEGQDVYVQTLNDYVEDMIAFRNFLETRFQVREKIILHGNSLGGLVGVYWALKYPEKIRGMILSSPCLGMRLPPFLMKVNQFMNRTAPRFIYRNPVYPPHLTHSQEEMEIYKSDPLIKRRISARLVHEMVYRGHDLESYDEFDFPFPVYMMLAELEKVVDAEKAKLFFQKVNAPDKKLRTFPDFYHELFHELGQDQAFETFREYLKLILSSTQPGSL